MTDLVRKGALAADRMSRDAEVAVACDDLARLADFGALAGVAEIVRERLRQVEALGYTAESDDQHTRDELPGSARFRLGHLLQSRVDGTADYPEDEDKLRTAGALCAAEIDRLLRMMTPGEPMVTKTGRVLTDAEVDRWAAEADRGCPEHDPGGIR